MLHGVVYGQWRTDAQLRQPNQTPTGMMSNCSTVTLYSLRKEPPKTKQIWFADDGTDGGCLIGLRRWWDCIVERGPAYEYHPNPTKTCLLVGEEGVEMAKEVFQGTGISVTEDGK